jgi:hypothetical protein
MDPSLAYGQLTGQLRTIIARVREDVEARSDPALEEIANALEVICELVAHSHEQVMDTRARIDRLEAKGA